MKKKDDILMEEELEEEEESQVAASTDEEDKDSEPEKPRKPKTILVPKVQNMDDYLMKHYKNYIIQELNKRLVDGELTEIVGVPVKSEHIIPDECCFRRFSYWRLNQCDFLIDIELRVELRVETPAGVDTDFYSFYVELWFSFCEDEEECEFERIGLLESKPEHEGEWKLDKYLVPILRRDEIDEYAEEIWAERCPDAAKDQKLRRPHALTEKMHLSVISLPLHKRGDTKSIIFFHEGTVLIQPDRAPGEHNDPPPVEEHVPANTIVINTHTEGGMGNDLDIYHECIHYEWHYLHHRRTESGHTVWRDLRRRQREAAALFRHQRYTGYGVSLRLQLSIDPHHVDGQPALLGAHTGCSWRMHKGNAGAACQEPCSAHLEQRAPRMGQPLPGQRTIQRHLQAVRAVGGGGRFRRHRRGHSPVQGA